METRPIYKKFKKIFNQTHENCGNIHYPLRGVQNGYLGITITVAKYQNVSGTQWVNSVHPGLSPNPTGVNQ